ncbi:MAG: TolC family protein [Desulfobacterota bacterium]|jgi:outer membrane protein TolC|nr:TolC family protein [Thermodesulfobacteriota bacterium]
MFFLTIVFALISGVLRVQPSGAMTLEESLKMAVERNPRVKAQNQEVFIKEMDKKSQFSRMLPSADLSYGYARLNESPSMAFPAPIGTVPLGTKDNYELSVEAIQVLFAGGALYNSYLIAKNDQFAAEIDREQTIRNLKLLVIDAYYGVIKTRQLREVAKTSVTSVKSLMDVSNAFFNQGMIPKNNLLEAQVRYSETEQNLISAENAVMIAESNLNLLLVRDLSEEISIDSEIPLVTMDIPFDQSLQTAFENRQEIKTTKLQLDNAEKGITIARSAFMPRVAATYTYSRAGEDPDVEDDSWEAGIGLNWNIFQGGGSYWNYNKAQYTSTKVGYLLESLKNVVTLEVKNSYLNVLEAQARLQVAEKTIAQAQENFRIEKDRYNLQVSTSTDVLRAEALLSQAQSNLISARADQARAMAALRASMGTL